MTEKQYSLIYHGDNGGAFIKDNEKGIEWYHDSCASLLEIVDKLNELSDENKELQKENEQLKQEIDTLQEQIVHFDIDDV